MNRPQPPKKPCLLYVINVDWYFMLHWLDRACAAKKLGFDVHLATRFTREQTRHKLQSLGFTLYDVAFSRSNLNPLRELSCLRGLRRIFRIAAPTLVHNVTIKPVVLGGLLCRLEKIPSVLSLPGLGSLYTSQKLLDRALRWFVEQLLRLPLMATRSITLLENQHDRTILVERHVLSENSARVIAGAGVDLNRFLYIRESEKPPLKILFAARLIASKGLESLVEAVGALSAKGLDLQLHVAGILDGDSRDAIDGRQIDAWRALDYVVWHGEVKDVERLISACHIVCLPTRYGEGIPRILIEAAACGRPVVSTRVPGCSEFVRHGTDGLLADPGNIQQLEKALQLLAERPDLRQSYGAAGREKVSNLYSNEIVVSKTLGIYNELLESQPVGR